MNAAPAEVVRRAYAAFESRDLPTLLALFDDAIEIVDPDLPGGGTFRGHAGATRYFGELVAGFASHGLEVGGLVEEGGRVVAAVHHRTRARGSDADITLDDAHVWTVADGRVTRIEMYLSLEDALHATREA